MLGLGASNSSTPTLLELNVDRNRLGYELSGVAGMSMMAWNLELGQSIRTAFFWSILEGTHMHARDALIVGLGSASSASGRVPVG